jgi:hypothetical protein
MSPVIRLGVFALLLLAVGALGFVVGSLVGGGS